MVNVKSMQSRIDKLLSVFTNLTNALDSAVSELKGGIRANECRIEELTAENAIYAGKIVEYEALMASVKGIVKPVENK